ncbi:MAG: hypothetical protein KGS61_13340 [Verrucomicrobia bacterium]|nr:hypothetical protein [Verrucomicrobiota bacterium]
MSASTKDTRWAALEGKVAAAWVWRRILPVLLVMPASLAAGGVPDIVGRYVGAWTNITFGSTGKAVIAIQVTGTNANLAFDMDGYVFGQMDPPLINMPGTVQGDIIQLDDQGVGMFGNITGNVDATHGTLTATLTNIPGGFILQVTATGTVTNSAINLAYTVSFPGAPSPTNPARGAMSVILIPPITITQFGRQGTSLMLQWSGGQGPFTVQQATDPSLAVWSDVTAATTNTSATVPVPVGGNAILRVAGQ